MTADKAEKGDKLQGLNHTLTSVENELLRKRADRSDKRYFDVLRHLDGSDDVSPEPSEGEPPPEADGDE